MARNKFTSETARKAAKKRKGTKLRKTLLWDELGDFLVNDGAEIYMKNLKTQMLSDDPKEQSTAMNMYKDTLEFFKPKLSRSEVKNEGAQELKIIHEEIKSNEKSDKGNNNISEFKKKK